MFIDSDFVIVTAAGDPKRGADLLDIDAVEGSAQVFDLFAIAGSGQTIALRIEGPEHHLAVIANAGEIAAVSTQSDRPNRTNAMTIGPLV